MLCESEMNRENQERLQKIEKRRKVYWENQNKMEIDEEIVQETEEDIMERKEDTEATTNPDTDMKSIKRQRITADSALQKRKIN